MYVSAFFEEMEENAKKILFVNSEIYPYLPESDLSAIGRYLPQGIQERGHEIRSFMPRYGCINERKHQLHEVIRLSGMNIIISDVDRPLVIKVASISAARMQVYFIDNEDYFRRKQITFDEKGKFFEDNDERAIFFAKGILETVKKLRWAPDIIHCHGWISHLVPLYLKKIYHDDPIFASSKVVLSLYNDAKDERFSADFMDKIVCNHISKEDISELSSPNGTNLAKTAVRYSDALIIGNDKVSHDLVRAGKENGIPILEYNADSLEDGTYMDEYNSFYNSL